MTETVEQFLARGGEIRHIPRGAMAEAGWKDADFAPNSPAARQRSFERMAAEKAEREARKAADAAVPAPKKPERAPKPAKAPKPRKVAEPRPPKATRAPKPPKPARPGPEFARPGTGKRQVLDAIWSEWTTVAAISQKTGITTHNVREYLRLLRARGLVECAGSHKQRLWRLARGEAPPLPAGTEVPRPPAELVAEAFEAVKAGHQTLRAIAKATGQKMRSLSTRLHRLKKAGRLTFDGFAKGARWRVVDAPDR